MRDEASTRVDLWSPGSPHLLLAALPGRSGRGRKVCVGLGER